MSTFFWTDHVQAQERLSNSYVMHGDTPVYVAGISAQPGGKAPLATAHRVPDFLAESISLDDPKFFRFRKLPAVGWVNNRKYKTGMFVERRPVRTRQHGLSNNNVTVGMVRNDQLIMGSDYNFDTVARDPGYVEACQGAFPPLEQVLTHLREGSTIAVGDVYAVYRDKLGLRWLFRSKERVALFPGTDSLLLLKKHGYLKEEILETSYLPISNIKEF